MNIQQTLSDVPAVNEVNTLDHQRFVQAALFSSLSPLQGLSAEQSPAALFHFSAE